MSGKLSRSRRETAYVKLRIDFERNQGSCVLLSSAQGRRSLGVASAIVEGLRDTSSLVLL